MVQHKAEGSVPVFLRKSAKKILATLLGTVLFIQPVRGQTAPDVGSPLIRNFTIDDYSAFAQNWAVAQDSRGVMYFGNGSGILEFDGKSWTLIPVPNNSMIRSLSLGQDDMIFYGGVGTFGYLGIDSTGKIQPVSLVEKVEPEKRVFNDVWKTFATSRGIYFLTDDKVFRYHDDAVAVIQVELIPRYGFKVGDTVLLFTKENGLSAVRENEVIPLPQSHDFAGKGLGLICGSPFRSGKAFLAARSGACFLYDLDFFYDASSGGYDFTRQPGAAGLLVPFATEISEYINNENNLLNDAYRIDDDRYVLTTMRGGLFVIGPDGRIIRLIDKRRGLQDDIVRDVFYDRLGNLWLALNSGISYVEFDSPISQFNIQSGLPAFILAAIRFNERLYASTFTGVYVLTRSGESTQENSAQTFVQVENCTTACFSFLAFKDMLLAGFENGVSWIRGRSGLRISKHSRVYCMGTSRKFPDHVFLGLLDGISAIEIKPSRKEEGRSETRFNSLGKFPGIADTIRKIVEDGDGNLWLTTALNGLIHLRFTGVDPSRFEITRYGKEQGLPRLDWNYTQYYQNRLIVTTTAGIYEAVIPQGTAPDPKSIRFIPESTFGKPFLDPPAVLVNILVDKEGNLLVGSDRGIFLIKKKADGTFQWEKSPFRKIPINDVENYLDERGILWVPTIKGLFRYDPSIKKVYDIPYKALIRKVVVGKNRVVFNGAYYAPGSGSRRGELYARVSLKQPESLIPVLSYRDNSLAFEYAAGFFESTPGLQFKHILEKFETEWTGWSTETRTEYTNLREGTYTFRVRARNVYEHESEEAVFRISIRPPWYRTIPAYLAFIVFGAAGFAGILKLYTMRLRREKARLEELVALRTQELKEASLTDPLTGLRNRRYMTEILRDDITAFIKFKKFIKETKDRRNKIRQDRMVFGVIVMDIDFFKTVNDTYGHEVGDQVLKQCAEILKASVRADDAVMRIGGEEFMVVLKRTLPEFIEIFANKIRAKVQEMDFSVPDGTIMKKTCSLGFTSFPVYSSQPELVDFERTVMIADLGLLFAKSHGRNLAVHLVATEILPRDEEEVRLMATSLDYALKNSLLKIEIKNPPDL
jgi:diguanylate cyclase (GGDEF)-like protein